MPDPAATDEHGRPGARLFPNLFAPLAVGSVTFKNRILVTGHMTMTVADGAPDARQLAYHQARARGGAAAIVMAAAAVHATALRGTAAIDASRDACIPGYARAAEACGRHGCPVIGQLFHPGREMTFAADGSRLASYAPSAVPSERFHSLPRGHARKAHQGSGRGLRRRRGAA